MTIRRRIAAVSATFALATGGVLVAGAQATEGGGPDNVVWSQTTGTNARDVGSSVVVGSYAGDHLTSTNVARAESTDCTDCRTVAVAVQAVFATGHPSTVEPVNAAIALNQNCLRCTTYAYAYQYVLTTDGPVVLRKKWRKRIARVRADIADVANSDELAPEQLDSRLNELAARFKANVDAGLRDAGEHPHGDVDKDEDSSGA